MVTFYYRACLDIDAITKIVATGARASLRPRSRSTELTPWPEAAPPSLPAFTDHQCENKWVDPAPRDLEGWLFTGGASLGQIGWCRAASKNSIFSSIARQYVVRTASGWDAWASSRASSVQACCSNTGSA